ncbi:acyltransferase [Psychroserpens damuponensis]|uniref:acyltransferase n=1 Tax=Psychroserpens damuponensis TaxID=943936 RepID=UPI000694B932|nr:transferase [Psychroserpens damuponensis]
MSNHKKNTSSHLGIKKRIKFFFKVNWYKTLYFNFKMLPFKQAKILPFYFYGKVKFSSLRGTVEIKAPIKRAMIGFGQKFEQMSVSKGIGELFLDGTLVFKGHAHFGKDVFLYVKKEAYCEFGFMGCLGSDVKLLCTNRIIIGNWTGIGYESQVIDTNSHTMINSKTGERHPISAPIELGDYNAVSNRVSIMSNTKTPDNCVIASNSLCNKDYTKLGSKILIGGLPAKLIKRDFVRDWESEKEDLLRYKRVKL